MCRNMVRDDAPYYRLQSASLHEKDNHPQDKRTRREGLLELVSLVRVGHAEGVEVLGAADLELSHALHLLDLHGCMMARAVLRIVSGHAVNMKGAASDRTAVSEGARSESEGRAQRASFLLAVRRKSLISLICFGCDSEGGEATVYFRASFRHNQR